METLEVDVVRSGDLRYQRVTVGGRIGAGAVRTVATEAVPNIEELIGEGPEWFDDHNGVIQAVLLACLSSIRQWREAYRGSVLLDSPLLGGEEP